MSAPITASGVGRALACSAANALPAAPEPSSADARYGTAVHAWLAGVVEHGTFPLPDDPKARALCAKIDVGKVPRGRPELALAYDVLTGNARELLRGPRWSAYTQCAPTEIPGTMDVLASDDDGLTVIDWKTEQWVPHDAEADRPQLQTYALAVARAYGVDEVRARVVIVAENGTLATPMGASWTWGWEDLATWGDTLLATWERVERARERHARGEVLDVREGPHCRYCPALLHCPATRAAMRLVTARGAEDAKGTLRAQDIGEGYVAVQKAELVIERLRGRIKDHVVAHGEVPTGDGRVLRLDGRGALRLAKERA